MKATEIKNPIFSNLIEKKIVKLSEMLNIEVLELRYWLEQYKTIDEHILLSFLHLAICNCLDPLLGEVTIWNDDQSPYPAITIDGWIKLMNQHPAFMGVEFNERLSSDGQKLESILCTITRSDRSMPICAQEYLEEVKNDHVLWKTMPRRMLRHRALQQCARLAFGISTPELAPTIKDKTKIATHELEMRGSSISAEDLVKPHSEIESIAKCTKVYLEGNPEGISKVTRTKALKQRLTHQQ